MREASVATKMSWISKRQISRLEDMAYCLLGLFDVNMPLLYGEGRKAFLRLEREIIKKLDDESIFAWTSPNALNNSSGLLALWPDSFADSADLRVPDPTSSDDDVNICPIGIVEWRPPAHAIRRPYITNSTTYPTRVPNFEKRPYATTNKGLEFSAGLRALPMLVLKCWKNANGGRLDIIIELRKQGNSWERVDCRELKLDLMWDVSRPVIRTDEIQTIYIKQDGL